MIFKYKVTILLALSCTLEVACKLQAIVFMCREWSSYFFACGSGGGGVATGGGRLLPTPLIVKVAIFNSRKRNAKYVKVLAYAATANYLGILREALKKINYDKYNGILLLLPLKKRNR